MVKLTSRSYKDHGRKIAYSDWKDALQAIWEMRHRKCTPDPDLLHPYLCPTCGQWHVGHYPGSWGQHTFQSRIV